MHYLNTPIPILLKVEGNLTSIKFLQLAKVSLPIASTPSEIINSAVVILKKDLQSITFIFLGITKVLNFKLSAK